MPRHAQATQHNSTRHTLVHHAVNALKPSIVSLSMSSMPTALGRGKDLHLLGIFVVVNVHTGPSDSVAFAVRYPHTSNRSGP